MTQVKTLKQLADLAQDTQNANKGTERGIGMLDHSLRHYGAGRSIVCDKHGTVIAGNKTLQSAADIGMEVEVVQSDGKRLIVVQRTDLDLSQDKAARELAYADNRAGQVGLDWDMAQIAADMEAGIDIGAFWLEGELEAAAKDVEPPDDPTVDNSLPKNITCPHCGHSWTAEK